MSAEIITIGTEILHGLVRDTNSVRIAEQLASIGIEVLYETTVGDDAARMGEALRIAGHRARVIVATGGLGATPDDLTRKVIATVFRRRLVLDEVILDRIRARFRERGVEMPAINETQALVPKGAKIIENPRGLAPGLHFTHQEAEFFFLPGIPAEAEGMMGQYVLPHLRAGRPGPALARRVVRTVGISESALAERLQALEADEPLVAVGYLPHSSGVDITLATSSPDQVWLEGAIERCERRVRELAGGHVYGGAEATLSAVLGDLLLSQKLTIATAESFTGGGLGALITQTPGASRYFLGGVIAYSNRAKQEILGVKAATLERHGAVSAEVAEEMAAGARKLFESGLALSSTGIAGPEGGTAEKPVGLVYLGIASSKAARSARFVLGGTRDEVTARASAYALDMARRHLAEGMA
jgi:nicotinamide-nucleotide amidase